MKKSQQNFLIDVLGLIGFVFLTSTGIIMHYLLPPGSGRGKTIWNLDRHEWGTVHFWVAMAFLAILAFHLIWHWKWIVNLVKGREREKKGRRALLGIVGVLALLMIAVAPIVSPVQSNSVSHDNHQQHDREHAPPEQAHDKQRSDQTHDEHEIRGSLTLQEVYQKTGVPVSYMLEELGLPADTDPTSKMGKLKREYGFEMHDVRDLIDQYQKIQ